MEQEKYQIPESVHSLLEQFTEMMTGEASAENVAVTLEWAMYMYIRSTMPPLVQHWTGTHPQEAEHVKQSIQKMRALNEAWKNQRQGSKAGSPAECEEK